MVYKLGLFLLKHCLCAPSWRVRVIATRAGVFVWASFSQFSDVNFTTSLMSEDREHFLFLTRCFWGKHSKAFLERSDL